MTTVSVSVPEELRKKMAKLDEVNWSAVARKAFEQQLQLEEFKAIVAKSQLTEADAKELANNINAAAAKRFRDYAAHR